MCIQSTWLTQIETFEQFRREADERPDQVCLQGDRPCPPTALTLATVAEERNCFWIQGPGWRARSVRKCSGELAQEHAERKSQKRRRKRKGAIANFRFIRER